MIRSRTYAWVYLLALAGYAWLIWNAVGSATPESTVCVFKQATGFACPSCGSTRSILSILHGDLVQALLINPLGYVGAIFLALLPLALVAGRLTDQDLVARFMTKAEGFVKRPMAAIPLAALVIVNWIWNITKDL